MDCPVEKQQVVKPSTNQRGGHGSHTILEHTYSINLACLFFCFALCACMHERMCACAWARNAFRVRFKTIQCIFQQGTTSHSGDVVENHVRPANNMTIMLFDHEKMFFFNNVREASPLNGWHRFTKPWMFLWHIVRNSGENLD